MFSFTEVFSQCDSVSALNEQIIQLANSKIGKKVGTGECWDLAKFVLDQTGAKWDGLYAFGRPLKKGECLMAGDIIQMEKVRMKYEEGGQTISEAMPHHTAVILKVVSADEVILIHQNTGYTGRKVGTSKFVFSGVFAGKYTVYRPVKG